MKKIITTALALILVFSVAAWAEEFPAVRTFAAMGEFQAYIHFDFEVPAGNCGNLKIYEQVPSYPSIYQEPPAHWELKNPGEIAPKGLYRFSNNEKECDPRFSLVGMSDDMFYFWGWTGREMEPEDIGTMVKGKWEANNYFNLSTDDSQYSYYMIWNSIGMTTSLDFLLPNIWCSGCEVVGVILADDRGFMNKLLTGRKLNQNNTLIKEDEVVIVIYKENYN